MDVQPLLPGTEALVAEEFAIESGPIIVTVHTTQPSARCPHLCTAAEN